MRELGYLEGISNAQTRFLGEGAVVNVKGDASATGPRTANPATARRIWIAANVPTLAIVTFWFSKIRSVTKSLNRVALIRISHPAAEATSRKSACFVDTLGCFGE